MRKAIVDDVGNVVNVIEIDNIDDFELPDGYVLENVAEWINPGDVKTKLEPKPPVRTYDEKRRVEYMPIEDQLDAIMKGFEKLKADGAVLPVELNEVLDHRNAIKLRYPKN